MPAGKRYFAYKRSTILFITIGLLLTGFVNFNLLVSYPTAADNGAPPVNGTTTETWYVDSSVTRANEIITTRGIQVNATGRMEWDNIDADITGELLVESGGYFNLTNCVLKLTGNFTVNGTVNFKGVTLKFNSRSEGEFHGEVWGAMHITDLDSDNGTTTDASLITAFNTNFNYQFWVRNGAAFTMRYSIVRECGYYSPPYLKDQFGFFVQPDYTRIENNTFENCYAGVVYYYAHNNLLANNTLKSNTDGVQLWSSTWNTITNNIISNNGDDGIELTWASTNNTFSFNTISSNGDDGLDIDAGADNNRVLNNTFTNNDYGTMITDADGNLVANNTYDNNFYTGVGLYSGSTNNRIVDNYATDSIAGFSAVSAGGNYFARNTAESNTMGFMLQGSKNNQILHNKMISNSWHGVSLEQASSNNHIHYNNITGNSLRGIRVVDSASQVNATLNWWGDSTGPYHSSTNTGGQGDQVSNYVAYDPWLKKSMEDIDPSITTTDDNSTTEDQYYENTYATYDSGVGDVITWYFDTDAGWLSWGASNLTLYGTPDNTEVGAYWVRVNVTYGYGGTDEHNFTLTVINAAPKIFTSDVVTADEDAFYSRDYSSDDDGQGTITWSLDTNATWLSIVSATGVISGTPVNDDVGTFWVNVTVDDGNAGEDSHNFTLTVINTNDAPAIQTTDNDSAEADIFYQVAYTALDVDAGDTLTWTFASSAGWLSWGAANHTLYGTPQGTDAGTFWVRINVSDGNGGFDEHNFTLTVTNDNHAPVIQTADVKTAAEDSYYEVAYTALDADVSDTLTWTFASSAGWLSWGSANHTLYGTPRNADVGASWVRINVSDGNGGYDEHNFTLMASNVNDPPVITNSDRLFAFEDKHYVQAYTATDEDLSPVYTWMYSSNASWLYWSPGNKSLFGLPTNDDVGKYSVTVNVSDNKGGYDEHNFILTVLNTNDEPEILTADVLTTMEDEQYEVAYSAVDVDIGDELIWTYGSNAAWLSWGVTNHTLYGTPRNEDVGEYSVRVRATDLEGEFDEHQFVLTVANTNDAPVILTTDVTTTDEDVLYQVTYTASDVDPGDTWTWSLVTDASWLAMDTLNGTLYGTPGNDDVGNYIVKIKVKDLVGGFDEHQFQLTVLNVNDPPVIKGAPDKLVVKPDKNYEIDFNSYIFDIDNEKSELKLIENSEHAEVSGFGITFNYPATAKAESVEMILYDGLAYSEPHTVNVEIMTDEIDLPYVISSVPNGYDVPLNGVIIVLFNTEMNESSIMNAFSTLPEITGSYKFRGTMFNFSPDSDLLANTTYTIFIKRSAEDLKGNNLSSDYSWNFTTTIVKEPVSGNDSDLDGYPNDIDRFPYDPTEWEDTDNDNIGDNADPDDDNDGVIDEDDAFPNDPSEWLDTDGDEKGDNEDPDDDNDGLTDEQEHQLGTFPYLKDSDNDGYYDNVDDFPLDPTKWEVKESKKEGSSGGAIYIVILIFAAIIVFIIFLVFRLMRIEEPEPDEGRLEKEEEAEDSKDADPRTGPEEDMEKSDW